MLLLYALSRCGGRAVHRRLSFGGWLARQSPRAAILIEAAPAEIGTLAWIVPHRHCDGSSVLLAPDGHVVLRSSVVVLHPECFDDLSGHKLYALAIDDLESE